jgi:hypothetical protein
MIPAIGFIIGLYVITRSLEMLSVPKPIVAVMAVLSMLVSAFGLYTPAQAGSSIPSMPSVPGL